MSRKNNKQTKMHYQLILLLIASCALGLATVGRSPLISSTAWLMLGVATG